MARTTQETIRRLIQVHLFLTCIRTIVAPHANGCSLCVIRMPAHGTTTALAILSMRRANYCVTSMARVCRFHSSTIACCNKGIATFKDTMAFAISAKSFFVTITTTSSTASTIAIINAIANYATTHASVTIDTSSMAAYHFQIGFMDALQRFHMSLLVRHHHLCHILGQRLATRNGRSWRNGRVTCFASRIRTLFTHLKKSKKKKSP